MPKKSKKKPSYIAPQGTDPKVAPMGQEDPDDDDTKITVINGKRNWPKLEDLMYHYNRVRQDMDTRRTRKNGWNDVVSAYMGKLPSNWPFLSVVTDPRIRTTVLEKTSRLLNAKLQGRLVPREGGDIIKAEIMNALLGFNWDAANYGGSMIEKVALADQTTRLFGASFVLVYWNNVLNINEIKVIDQRDIGFDGAATHIRNARWVQIREFTTWDKLSERGYNIKKWKKMAEDGSITSQWRSGSYESIVKANKGLMDRIGEYDDPKNPVVEVITEWTPSSCTIFLPRVGVIVDQTANPYEHGRIPVAQLRYYPLGDDIYGESEVEGVLPLQRAINSILCGFIDEMTIGMRPPLKISSQGVRIETIQYGPGAQWIMANPNMVQEMEFSPQVIANFNATYPALVAAFNTAMGDNSLGISNVKGQFDQKTATEVRALSSQQNNRDQYNQLYLGEFLKDIMMMWLSNIKQYLFDDPTKEYHILKVLGKEQIAKFQQMKLDDSEIPDDAMAQISATVAQNPTGVTDAQLQQIMSDVSVPKKPVILNPDEKDPAKYQLKHKLDVTSEGQEANLYITREDIDGEYDYVPDVASMSTGALESMKQSRTQAIGLVTNPIVQQILTQQGQTINMVQLLTSTFEDSGMKDAESLFKPLPPPPAPPQGGMPGSPQGMPGSLPVPPQMNGQQTNAGGGPTPPGVPSAGGPQPFGSMAQGLEAPPRPPIGQ